MQWPSVCAFPLNAIGSTELGNDIRIDDGADGRVSQRLRLDGDGFGGVIRRGSSRRQIRRPFKRIEGVLARLEDVPRSGGAVTETHGLIGFVLRWFRSVGNQWGRSLWSFANAQGTDVPSGDQITHGECSECGIYVRSGCGVGDG
jgi:hypothetical protein